MTAIKLTDLTTGETIDTVDDACLDSLEGVLGDSTSKDQVFMLTSDTLARLDDSGVESDIVKNLGQALGEQDRLRVGYQKLKADAPWAITGRASGRDSRPLAGLQVLAHDRDRTHKDDFLGCAFTDADGTFEIRYEEADFKSKHSFIDFEGNPDIYLDLTDLALNVTKRTAVKPEADMNEHYELKLDFGSNTKIVRPVVGYYFIEEDNLQSEIDQLRSEIQRDEENAQAHFLLGLCLLELMKADLRKSEWYLPEIRSDDDVLAMAAIQEFDTAAALDPSRAEETKQYREYAQELQNLAL